MKTLSIQRTWGQKSPGVYVRGAFYWCEPSIRAVRSSINQQRHTERNGHHVATPARRIRTFVAQLHRRQAHFFGRNVGQAHGQQARCTPRMIPSFTGFVLGHPGQTPRVPFLLPFTRRSTRLNFESTNCPSRRRMSICPVTSPDTPSPWIFHTPMRPTKLPSAH